MENILFNLTLFEKNDLNCLEELEVFWILSVFSPKIFGYLFYSNSNIL